MFPKSSPDLNIFPNRRASRRESRAMRQSRQTREYEFKISNPFRDANEENLLPPQIRTQIQQMQYISNKSIKDIAIPECRRASNFLKNIQMMQELARKQELKFSGMVHETPRTPARRVEFVEPDLTPINMIEDDHISLELNGFYDYKDRIDDDFNIFDAGEMAADQPVYFYSTHNIEGPGLMEDEMNNYLE